MLQAQKSECISKMTTASVIVRPNKLYLKVIPNLITYSKFQRNQAKKLRSFLLEHCAILFESLYIVNDTSFVSLSHLFSSFGKTLDHVLYHNNIHFLVGSHR